MNSLNILYLYAELVGYQIRIFKVYTEKHNAKVYVVNWDKKKLKPYEPPEIENVTFIERSKFNNNGLFEYCKSLRPNIVYVSGWMDKGYLFVVKKLKNMGVPIVTGFDDIWTGSFRQRLGSLIFPFVLKKYFSHAWVAGPYQFEFAKRMGFENDKIIFDLLSANTSIFNQEILQSKGINYIFPKAFLYVGNFRKVKGVDILVKAYSLYLNKYHGKWKLICVGNGELEESLVENKEIEVIPFASSEKLIEISKRAGVFILPSRHDQWGVVVHEFASLGMPLLLSENVGARATFLIEGFNGLIFNNNSAKHLAEKMFEISELPEQKLREMGNNSYHLSKRIDVVTSAANFISILKLN